MVGVQPDPLPVVRRERRRLLPDADRDRHPPEIVHQRSSPELQQVGGHQTTLLGRRRGQLGDTGPLPSVWSGPTSEGREKAVTLAKEYLQDGYLVIIDDVIESVGELQVYQAGLDGIENRAVTLMPSEEEMERRDKMRPVDQRMGTRVSDARVQMAKLLSASSVVIDTSDETVDAIAQRILDALEELE